MITRFDRIRMRIGDLYGELREHTLCEKGFHCRPSKRVEKFNGGAGAWLCCYCYLIIVYGHNNTGGRNG